MNYVKLPINFLCTPLWKGKTVMKHKMIILIGMLVSVAAAHAANDVSGDLDEKCCQLINGYVNALSKEASWNIPTFDVSSGLESDKKGVLLQAVIDSVQQEQWTSKMQATLSLSSRIHLADAAVEERDKKRTTIKRLVTELIDMQSQERHAEQATVLSDDDGYTSFDACDQEGCL